MFIIYKNNLNQSYRMTFIEELFINKKISDSSKKLYMHNLKKLNLNKPIEDLDFLKNIDEIEAIMSKYKPTTNDHSL